MDIEALKQRIDLNDLAEKLGLERPQGSGNYKSPTHKDKNPSLSVFFRNNAWGWKDHSADRGGSCIDLVMYVENVDVSEAIQRLHRLYGIPLDTPKRDNDAKPTLAEFIASECLKNPSPAGDYLETRGIPREISRRAMQKKAVGWNTYASSKKPAGEPGHGGPGVAFIVRNVQNGRIEGVDVRYADPALNGGVKTQCQGEKDGRPWFVDVAALNRAHTVYIVESPINALSVEACGLHKGTVAIATRGTGTVDSIDWRFLNGKTVRICMDNDAPDDNGRMPGQNAAWKIHEALTALNIPSLLIDQSAWEFNDVNDILVNKGADELRMTLQRVEQWLIPGLPGEAEARKGKSRVFLPAHDFAQYWRFRVKEDFTTFVAEKTVDAETGNEHLEFSDVCGFRVAAVSRVSVSSANATMTGEADTSPRMLFSVSVESPLHKHRLVRKVLDDEAIHNIDHWRKFGLIFKPAPFARMLAIMYRTAGIGEREAINFVGLAWRKGKPVVNEGPDCYFTDPDKQCPYHNLTFPSGTREDAGDVLAAYQSTFKDNAATQLLVWAIGGHLKAHLGIWPHMVVAAAKGSGKSTLIKRLERSIGMTMFSGQSLQTEFRLLTSISHTSHPVGWEEISARRQDVIDKAVSLLQESYQYTVTRRGPDMTEYLNCAPVLLAGEDVPVRSLLGKVVRTDLTARMGPLIPENLVRFPVLQWLQHLATFSRPQVSELYDHAVHYCTQQCLAAKDGGRIKDPGARRMVANYAAMLTAWAMLADWLGLSRDHGQFKDDLIENMNKHMAESEAEREPWVWIMEIILAEISSGAYRFPWKVVTDIHRPACLVIRPSHIVHHLRSTIALRDVWNSLPVKSDRVLKDQLRHASVIEEDRVDITIGQRRESHMVSLSLARLEYYGLHMSTPES